MELKIIIFCPKSSPEWQAGGECCASLNFTRLRGKSTLELQFMRQMPFESSNSYFQELQFPDISLRDEGFIETELGALTSDRHPWGGVRSTLISQEVDRMILCNIFCLLFRKSISCWYAEQAQHDESSSLACNLPFSKISSVFRRMFFALSHLFS